MNRQALFLHGFCCIGPHLIAASISIVYDIKSWYDAIAAMPIVLLVCIALRNKFFFRGILHVNCLLLGIISQEVSRQPRSIDWNQLQNPEFLHVYLCTTHVIKGIGTFVKLFPSAVVINSPDKFTASWRDYVGWSMSILSSLYFLQEPNIYRNNKGMAEWRRTFAQIETLHWTGLALSASTNYEAFGWFFVLFNSLQSLLAYSFFYGYSDDLWLRNTNIVKEALVRR